MPLPGILLLVTQLERGGAQAAALRFAEYLHARGYPVFVGFFYDKANLLGTIQQQTVYPIDCYSPRPLRPDFGSIMRLPNALRRLYLALKQRNIEVIITYTHYSNVIGQIIAWIAGVPVRIASQQGFLIHMPVWLRVLDAAVINTGIAQQMIAVSQALKDFCVWGEHIAVEKITVIPNGVPVEDFNPDQWSQDELAQLRQELGISPVSHVVITVARLQDIKGHRYLIDAAPIIAEACPEAIFLLAGDGEERSALEQQIARTGLGERIRLLGSRSDVEHLLALSSVFVLPSLQEGMPNAVLEAMSARLPVVATAVGGTVEAVINEETGLLVPPADSAALAAAVIRLLCNPDLRQRMGGQGCERATRLFSSEAMCQRYESVVHALMHKAGA